MTTPDFTKEAREFFGCEGLQETGHPEHSEACRKHRDQYEYTVGRPVGCKALTALLKQRDEEARKAEREAWCSAVDVCAGKMPHGPDRDRLTYLIEWNDKRRAAEIERETP